MARDYDAYLEGLHEENHMADDYFDSRPDYREKTGEEQIGLSKTLMVRYGKTVRKLAGTKAIKLQKETTHWQR